MDGYLIKLARSRSEDEEIVMAAKLELTKWGGITERKLWLTEEVDALFFSHQTARSQFHPLRVSAKFCHSAGVALLSASHANLERAQGRGTS